MTRPQDTNEEPNPSGLCMCGCGQRTPLASETRSDRILVAGKPTRFVSGHTGRIVPRSATGPNPSGVCQCGCGNPAPIAKTTHRSRGNIAGQPQMYIRGHRRKIDRVDWRVAYKVDERTGCWEWTGERSTQGYGRFAEGGRRVAAHRVVYEATKGAIPKGMQLDHLCRNPICVNPDHLEPVTGTENVRRGSAAKLTQADVWAIREMIGTMTHREIAVRFRVTRACIAAIARNRRWRDHV